MTVEISVVIPTFNRAHTLRRAMDSVLNQKGASFEVLIVDDGSSDGTKSLVGEVSQSHSHARYFYQPNRGPSATRNVGIKEARGLLIAFLSCSFKN